MTGNQILIVLLGIAAIYWGMMYVYESGEPVAAECSGEFRMPLPFCTDEDLTGNYLTIRNECDADVTLKWDFLGGTEHVERLAPGEEKRMATFPLKIKSVSCCSNFTSCF